NLFVNNTSLATPIFVVIFGLLIWAGAAWLCWQNWQRNPNRRVAGRLEGLRFFLITLLVFTLLRPEYIQHLQRKEAPEIAVLTDGDWNAGKSPLGVATRYREQNIPVFTVGVGRETPVPDLALENVSAPAYGLFGEQIAIPFKISSHLPREVKTSVSVFDQYG